MNDQECWDKLKSMGDKERLAIKRCAVYQMNEEDLEEIGSSDINHHAAAMIRCGEWPFNRIITCKCGATEEVPLGYLVDFYSKMVGNDSWASPSDALNEISMCRACSHRLPNHVYDKKHLLTY
jgi:hypothetical protein